MNPKEIAKPLLPILGQLNKKQSRADKRSSEQGRGKGF
jgi:hypothetical protein